MSILGDIGGVMLTAGPYILEAQLGGATGPEKLDQVVAKVTADIEAVGGLDFPAIIPAKWHAPVVRGAVQLAVTLGKLAGLDKRLQQVKDFLSRELGISLNAG
jgi:hypothetical protein